VAIRHTNERSEGKERQRARLLAAEQWSLACLVWSIKFTTRTSLWREQLAAHLVEIGHREDGLRPCQILCQPQYRTLMKPHNCLTTRKACMLHARVRERSRLIVRQRPLNGRLAVGRRLMAIAAIEANVR
jgi:hypothetical protein